MVLPLWVCLAENRLSTCSAKEFRKRGALVPTQISAMPWDRKIVELRKILPQRNRGEARNELLKIETPSYNAGWRNCHYASPRRA